jgi:DUF971 family protein
MVDVAKFESDPPIGLVVHQQSRELEVTFADAAPFRIAFELMRVYSPSAQVQGHSPDQAVLQTGKRMVNVVGIEPVGHYGIKPTFSDGHDTGIYTWGYLRQLGAQQAVLWQAYEQKLSQAGASRDHDEALNPSGQAGKKCGN